MYVYSYSYKRIHIVGCKSNAGDSSGQGAHGTS